MCTQRRRTAGIRIGYEKTQIHIDPGPGALVHSIYAGLTPMQLSGIIVTHCHPDHYTDAEVLVEAMTGGTARHHGVLAAAKSVLEGGVDIDPSVSKYHQRLPLNVYSLTPGSKFNTGEFRFKANIAKHTDPDTVGFTADLPDIGKIGYTSDTEFSDEVAESYKDCRLLILCTMRPKGEPLVGHLCSDDAVKIIDIAKPRFVVTTHYGIKILNADPVAEALWIQTQTGTPVVASTDGMWLKMDKAVTVYGSRKTDTPRSFDV